MTQDITQTQVDMLQELLQSLGSTEYNGQKASPELVQKLAERLEEMLGKDGDQPANRRGEMLNEDGEPIMEINELVQDEAKDSLDGKIPEDSLLEPLHTLSEVERARRKAEMDRILDALEEEESRELQLAKDRAKSQNRSFMQERKRESEKLARAMEERKKREKKMGKALLSVLGDTPSPSTATVKPKTEPLISANEGEVKSEKPEKPSEDIALPQRTVKQKAERRDVPAALPSSSSRWLMKNSLMKADVIERFPASRSSDIHPSTPTAVQKANSDDEDHGEKDLIIHQGSDHGMDVGEEQIENDDLGLVDALHQQEIEAEYYALRENVMNNSILAGAIENENQDPWDKEHVSLDATLTHPPLKTKGSRFKASRQSPFTPQSIEGRVVSPSVLRGAVRMGKLENGNLVGKGDDSDDELAADVEEKLAIDATKRGLLSSTDAGNFEDPTVPLQDNSLSSTNLPQAEEKIAPRATSASNALLTIKDSVVVASPPDGLITPGDEQAPQKISVLPVSGVSSPGFNSVIIESPSFAPPQSIPKPDRTRSPAVMFETVRESTPSQSPSQKDIANSNSNPQKISRFKAMRS